MSVITLDTYLPIIIGSLKSVWDDRVALSVDTLTEDDQFDIASCQFAMHYMFQSKKKANHFFQQVSNHLKSGGELIAVTMDSRVIAEELLNDLHGVFDGFTDDGVLLPTTDDHANDDDEEEKEDKDAVDDNNVVIEDADSVEDSSDNMKYER